MPVEPASAALWPASTTAGAGTRAPLLSVPSDAFASCTSVSQRIDGLCDCGGGWGRGWGRAASSAGAVACGSGAAAGQVRGTGAARVRAHQWTAGRMGHVAGMGRQTVPRALQLHKRQPP